jgi:hypothetical protein
MDAFLASPGETRSGDATEVVTIPTALTYARLVRPGLALAAGIFVTDATDYTLRTQLRRPQAGDAAVWTIEFRNAYSDTHAGIGIGRRVGGGLSWGVGWLAAYQRVEQTVQMAGGLQSGRSFSAYSYTLAVARLTTEVTAGVRWTGERVRLGASAVTPRLRVHDARERTDVSTCAGFGPDQDAMGFSSVVAEGSSGVGLIDESPALVRIGAAWVAGPTTAELDLDVRALAEDANTTWNASVGIKRALSTTTTIGGGLFTDRSSAETTPLHYYGGAAGFERRTPISTDATGRSTVVLGSTLGVRYAHASGESDGYRLGADPLDVETIALERSDLSAHELSVYFGSGMTF